MSGSLGDGTGKWQLEVRSNTDIEVMSMIRTPDGFLTSVSDVVPKDGTDANEILLRQPREQSEPAELLALHKPVGCRRIRDAFRGG